MATTLDSTPTSRLRRVLASGGVTESELRKLGEEADGWARSLEAQLESAERRLARLTADPASPIREIADELHRVESLRPQLAEVRSLLAELEERARELRSAWLRAALQRS